MARAAVRRMKDSTAKRRSIVAHGDFQTPPALADRVAALLARRGITPRSALEPTVGKGNLLFAVMDRLPSIDRAIGVELNPDHAGAARAAARARGLEGRVEIRSADVFTLDLAALSAELPRPLLVIGNPPWVTSATQGAIGSDNLPAKSNRRRYAGLDAVTGKSNFDVSEWILIELAAAVAPGGATLAMLCKEGVARRVLRALVAREIPVRKAALHAIDAREHFDASVEACLFLCDVGGAGEGDGVCEVYSSLGSVEPSRRLSFSGAEVLADADAYAEVRHLDGSSPIPWRSGIKHDRARLMELRRLPEGGFLNGAGERLSIEEEHVYPLLKSSDLASGHIADNRLWMLVPQRRTGEDPRALFASSPRAWAYLESHREAFRGRRSSIYERRPDYAIFGVGEYSFAPYKIAISGMYKSLRFSVVGPLHERPVVFDDTCYFLPCAGEAEARAMLLLLSSPEARRYYECRIFWGDKRPITKELLGSLDLGKLARHAGERVIEGLGEEPQGAAIAAEIRRLGDRTDVIQGSRRALR